MLVLTRKAGQGIVIGDNIFITVLGFVGNQVSFGLDAPDSIIINRSEVDQEIKSKNTQIFLKPRKKYCPSQSQIVNNHH